MKIALIGPYPPPYGGVSLHLKRMKEYLDGEGLGCVVYDLSAEHNNENKADGVIPTPNTALWLVKYFLSPLKEIIHYHGSNWKMRVLLGLMGSFGRKVILTSNNTSLKESLASGNSLKSFLLRYSLRNATILSGINEDMRSVLLSTGIKEEKIRIITSFIPPSKNQNECSSLPKKISEFMKTHRPIISAGAHQLNFHEGVDVYGLDMCVNLVERVRLDYPKVGLVFCMPKIKEEEYLKKILSIINEKNLGDNILIFTEPLSEVVPVWANSDVFVRPTYLDGEGITIKEAMHSGTPVVTSDACRRPKEAVVFRNRDLYDFVDKVKEVLSNLDKYKVDNIISENAAVDWVKVYRGLLE